MAEIYAAKEQERATASQPASVGACTSYTTHQMDQMKAALDSLNEKGLSFRDLMFFTFDPAHKQGVRRWQQFFAMPGTASGILDLWVTKENSAQARSEVLVWSLSYAAHELQSEASQLTDSGMLQMKYRELTTNLVQGFTLSGLFEMFSTKTPAAIRLFHSFVTSARAAKRATSRGASRVQSVLTSVILQSMGQYSRANNIFKRLFGLYLYATGAQRQTITVLSHLGLSDSYTSITGKSRLKQKKKDGASIPDGHSAESLSEDLSSGWTKGGSLHQLSQSMRKTYRSVASTGLFAGVYDNINWTSKVAEQTVGRADSLESGTCATIWPLWG